MPLTSNGPTPFMASMSHEKCGYFDRARFAVFLRHAGKKLKRQIVFGKP